MVTSRSNGQLMESVTLVESVAQWEKNVDNDLKQFVLQFLSLQVESDVHKQRSCTSEAIDTNVVKIRNVW